MSFNLTAAEENELRTALSALDISSDAGGAQATAALSPRGLFCRYWPIVKQVLGFLRDLPLIPGPVKAAIALVIAAGDTVSKVICG